MLLSAGDLISQSVALYKEHKALYLKYMLALFVPTTIITLMGAFLEQTVIAQQEPGVLVFLLFLVVVIGGSLAAFWISLAFIKVIAKTHQKQPLLEMKEELNQSIKYVVPAILVSLLTGIIIFIGTLLLIIPGIIFAIWFSFVIHDIVLDNKRGMESLKTSKALVKGRWWSVFWRILAPALVFGIITILLQGLVSLPVTFIDTASTTGLAIETFFALLASVVSIVMTPLSTAAITLLYLDLRAKPMAAEKK